MKKVEFIYIMKVDGVEINNHSQTFEISQEEENIPGIDLEPLEDLDSIEEVRGFILDEKDNIPKMLAKARLQRDA